MYALLQRLDRLAYAVAPGLAIAALILCSLVPVRVPWLPAIAPLLPLMAVYHFSLTRPEALPRPALLLLGLAFDLLQGGPGTPIGVSALQFLLMSEVVAANRRFVAELSAFFLWFGYAALAAAAVAMAWLALSGLAATIIDPRPALAQYVVSLFVYPILGWVLGRGPARDPFNPTTGPGGRA